MGGWWWWWGGSDMLVLLNISFTALSQGLTEVNYSSYRSILCTSALPGYRSHDMQRLMLLQAPSRAAPDVSHSGQHTAPLLH